MGDITNVDPIELVEDKYMEYSAYVISERALPDFRDGLKPVYRKAIYSLHKKKAYDKFLKSRAVDGDVSKIHPHGSAYPTMVGMTQGDRHIHPLLDGKGNFGSYLQSEPMYASERYTQIKLSEFGRDMYCKEVSEHVVPFIKSYNNEVDIPTVLPSRFPMGLVIPQSGMAVGYACSIPSYNLNDISNALLDHINGKEIPVLIPDFATGGYILNDKDTIKRIHKQGNKGSVRMRGHAEIDGNKIVITELPYGSKTARIVDKVADLSQTDKLPEVRNVLDLTGEHGMKIVVEAKRGSDMEFLLDKLYAYTDLENTYPINMTFLKNDRPVVMPVPVYLENWYEWRKATKRKEISHKSGILWQEIHTLEGLEKILVDVDKAVDIIRNTAKSEIINALEYVFDMTTEQAEYITRMSIRNVNKDIIQERVAEISEKKKEYEYLEALLKDDKEIGKVLSKEIKGIADKYGVERKTEIVNEFSQVQDVKKQVELEQIDDSDYWVHTTELGYSYKTKLKGDKLEIRSGDKIVSQINLNNREDVLVVLDTEGVGHRINVHEIPKYKKGEMGFFLPQEIGIDMETIVGYSAISDKYKYVLYFLNSDKEGKVAKIPIESFNVGVNMFRNAYNTDMELFHVELLSEDREMEATINNRKFSFDTSKINPVKSRSTNGVFVNSRRGVYQNVY